MCRGRTPVHDGTERTMSDMSTGPTDANPTARYDPPSSPPPAVPPIGPSTGVSPVPSPTPPADTRWRRRGDGSLGTIVFGVILVALGLWFFADQTLGLDMPRIRWSELWPILIIGLGAWIVLGSLRRDR
jgi:hypothetical protein